MSDKEDAVLYTQEEMECLKDRKWWCFLLSSIFTFLAGLLIVLLWRALSIVCCRKDASPEYSQSDLKQQQAQLPKPPRQAKEEFEGTFVTDAKDWAGELISGQTTTGRILVYKAALSSLPNRQTALIQCTTPRSNCAPRISGSTNHYLVQHESLLASC